MLKNGCATRQVIEKIGGASRDRTDDLIVANDALSQLSYSPILRIIRAVTNFSSALDSGPAPSGFLGSISPREIRDQRKSCLPNKPFHV